MARYGKAMVAGMVVGAAVGVMMFPQLDSKTKRKMKKMGKKALHMAEDKYSDVMYWVK